jgi:hypothetical protein
MPVLRRRHSDVIANAILRRLRSHLPASSPGQTVYPTGSFAPDRTTRLLELSMRIGRSNDLTSHDNAPNAHSADDSYVRLSCLTPLRGSNRSTAPPVNSALHDFAQCRYMKLTIGVSKNRAALNASARRSFASCVKLTRCAKVRLYRLSRLYEWHGFCFLYRSFRFNQLRRSDSRLEHTPDRLGKQDSETIRADLDNRLMASLKDSAFPCSGKTYSECGEGERDHAVFSK